MLLQLRTQYPLPIADEIGIDVLVSLAILQYAGDVESAFMRKSAIAHVRLPFIRLDIGQFVEEMRYLAEFL